MPCGTAPGFRSYASGIPVSVGQAGCSWASTVSGTNGMHLSFHVTYLYPGSSLNRAYGFQLRCLSE